ncbi:HNHc domain-containing protein [Fusarium sp. LHS14.1]|nr:HNHc domain-containing protein [Fusarium sp. LHS14.1]
MTIIRDPIDEPHFISGVATHSKPRFIDIIHPGYEDSGEDAEGNVLISLRAFDESGVDYDVAHTACAILAANRWDGYFSYDRNGNTKVVPPRDRILGEKSYYFYVPSAAGPSADPYPVVTRFGDWRFPHGHLPRIWAQFQDQVETDLAQNQATSGWCCLSNYSDPVESAHLVPSAQSNWWQSNRMARYSETTLFSTDPINAPANRLPLRSDIHKMFDERHFTFVPKLSCEEAHDGAEVPHPRPQPDSDMKSCSRNVETESRVQPASYLVGHVFNSTPSGQLPMLWHNRRVHTLPMEVSVECLFARFAWTVFSPTVFRDFLEAGKSRRILVWNHETRKYDIEEANPEKCRAIWSTSRSRSESPRKKQRRAESASQGEEGVDLYQEYHAASDVDSGYHDGSKPLERDSFISIPDEPERGRTRKRKVDKSCTRSLEACKNRRQSQRISLDST